MTERVDAGWSVWEFHGLDLGDARLNRRLLIMAEAFGAQPARRSIRLAPIGNLPRRPTRFRQRACAVSRDLAAAPVAHTRTHGRPCAAHPGQRGHHLSQRHPSSSNQSTGTDRWRTTWLGNAFAHEVSGCRSYFAHMSYGFATPGSLLICTLRPYEPALFLAALAACLFIRILEAWDAALSPIMTKKGSGRGC
jgi:hypothetical protein